MAVGRFGCLGAGGMRCRWLLEGSINRASEVGNGASRKNGWHRQAYVGVMKMLTNPIYAGGCPMTNLANTLVSQIAAHISADGLRPGDRLTERKPAEQFRVSRWPWLLYKSDDADELTAVDPGWRPPL